MMDLCQKELQAGGKRGSFAVCIVGQVRKDAPLVSLPGFIRPLVQLHMN